MIVERLLPALASIPKDVSAPIILLLDICVFVLLTLVLLWLLVYFWVNCLGPWLHAEAHAGLPTTTEVHSPRQFWHPASPPRAMAISPSDLSPPPTTGSSAASSLATKYKYHARSPAGQEDHRFPVSDTSHQQVAGASNGNWFTSLASRLQKGIRGAGGRGEPTDADGSMVTQRLLGDEEDGTSSMYADQAAHQHDTGSAGTVAPAWQQPRMCVLCAAEQQPGLPAASEAGHNNMQHTRGAQTYVCDGGGGQPHHSRAMPFVGDTPAGVIAAAAALGTATGLQLPTAGFRAEEDNGWLQMRSPNKNMTQLQMWQRMQAQQHISAASDESPVTVPAGRTADQARGRGTGAQDSSFAFNTLGIQDSQDEDGATGRVELGEGRGGQDGQGSGSLQELQDSLTGTGVGSPAVDSQAPETDPDRSAILLDSADLASLLSGTGDGEGHEQAAQRDGFVPLPAGMHTSRQRSKGAWAYPVRAGGAAQAASASDVTAAVLDKHAPAWGANAADGVLSDGVLSSALRLLEQQPTAFREQDTSGKRTEPQGQLRSAEVDKATNARSTAQPGQGAAEQDGLSRREGGLFGALQQAVQSGNTAADQPESSPGTEQQATLASASTQPSQLRVAAPKPSPAASRSTTPTQAQSSLSSIGRKMQAVANYVEPNAPPVTPSPATRATRANSPDETHELRIPMAVVTPEGSWVGQGHSVQPGSTHPAGLGHPNLAATAPIPTQLFTEGPLSLGRYLVSTADHAPGTPDAARQTVCGFDLEHSAAAAQVRGSSRSTLSSQASMPLPSSMLTAVVSPRRGTATHGPNPFAEPSFSLFVPTQAQRIWPAGPSVAQHSTTDGVAPQGS